MQVHMDVYLCHVSGTFEAYDTIVYSYVWTLGRIVLELMQAT